MISCDKCGYCGLPAWDGGCPECLMISMWQSDVIVVDEFGRDVWAKALARRYRREMEKPRW